MGVRETQRALSLSSTSVALYHLEKLREIGVETKGRDGTVLPQREGAGGFSQDVSANWSRHITTLPVLRGSLDNSTCCTWGWRLRMEKTSNPPQ